MFWCVHKHSFTLIGKHYGSQRYINLKLIKLITNCRNNFWNFRLGLPARSSNVHQRMCSRRRVDEIFHPIKILFSPETTQRSKFQIVICSNGQYPNKLKTYEKNSKYQCPPAVGRDLFEKEFSLNFHRWGPQNLLNLLFWSNFKEEPVRKCQIEYYYPII